MKAKRLKGISLIAAAAMLAALAAGCGGRSSSGGAAALPAPSGSRSTLRIANVTARTIVTVDGQLAPAASGTLTLDLAPGIHTVAVSRAGYTVANTADFLQISTAIGTVVDKTVAYTRESAPLPAGWAAAARPASATESLTLAAPLP